MNPPSETPPSDTPPSESLPSDLNPDVDEAVRAMEGAARAAKDKGRDTLRRSRDGLLARIEPQHYGFAAAVAVAFLGVAVLGPRVREMRRPRTLVERGDRALRRARFRAEDARDEAGRHLRRLGESAWTPR